MQNKGQIIWLDDVRDPLCPYWMPTIESCVSKSGFGLDLKDYEIKWVKNYWEFNEALEAWQENIPTIICFDHDLGVDQTGYDCAVVMIDHIDENLFNIPFYHIQSNNPVGKENIKSYIESYRKSLNHGRN